MITNSKFRKRRTCRRILIFKRGFSKMVEKRRITSDAFLSFVVSYLAAEEMFRVCPTGLSPSSSSSSSSSSSGLNNERKQTRMRLVDVSYENRMNMRSSISCPNGVQCSKITHKYWENFASVTPRTRIPQDDGCLRVQFN